MACNKQNIQDALGAIPTSNFIPAAKNLLAAFGYHSERTLLEQTGDVVDFIEQFPAQKENTETEKNFLEQVQSVWLAFQITSDEIASVAHQRIT